MCTKSIIKLDTAEEKISELDRQIKVHREKGLEIIEKRVRELRGTVKRWCVNMTGVPGAQSWNWLRVFGTVWLHFSCREGF